MVIPHDSDALATIIENKLSWRIVTFVIKIDLLLLCPMYKMNWILFHVGLISRLIPLSISFLFNKMLPTVAGDKLYFSAIAFLGVCKRLLWLLLLNVKAKACAIVYLTCWSHSRSISALLQVSATVVLVRFSDIVDASKQHEDWCDTRK